MDTSALLQLNNGFFQSASLSHQLTFRKTKLKDMQSRNLPLEGACIHSHRGPVLSVLKVMEEELVAELSTEKGRHCGFSTKENLEAEPTGRNEILTHPFKAPDCRQN